MESKKLCSICKEKPATLFLTTISSDNKKQNLDLCDECAKAKGVTDATGFGLLADVDVVLGLGAAQQIEQAAGGLELRCPRCGFTQADFKKSGRLGCPDCYKTFADGLRGLLKSMHKGTRHTGKAPESLRQSREMSDRLKTLQKRLAKAVETEDFEQAAVIRDEIKRIGERTASSKNLTR